MNVKELLNLKIRVAEDEIRTYQEIVDVVIDKCDEIADSDLIELLSKKILQAHNRIKNYKERLANE